jgi:hypothetical protein
MKGTGSIMVSIFWDDQHGSMSNYLISGWEIDEIIENYNYSGQLEMFTYLPKDLIKQWLYDVFVQEPYEIIIDGIQW